MSNTALDFVINLQTQTESNITAVERSRNVAYYCVHKTAFTADYVEITNASDIATYTDDEFAINLMNEGMNKIYLVFQDPDNLDGSTLKLEELNNLTFTWIFGQSVEASLLDLSSYDGVKVFSTANFDSADARPAVYGQAVVLSPSTEGLGASVFGRFLSQNGWKGMQYEQFSGLTPVITTYGDWESARDLGFTFLFSDATTVTVPSLASFQAGKLAVTGYYILEDLKREIQIALINYIATNKPPYIDRAIAQLESTASEVVRNYIDKQYIDSGTFTIPRKSSQLTTDIKAGMVEGATLEMVHAGEIWRISGTIKATS